MKDRKLFSNGETSRYESDDYKVNFSRKSIIIIAVLSLLLAFFIWMFAVAADSSVHNYTDVPIDIRNASHITDAGYDILVGTEAVSFRVRGRTSVINDLTDNSVVPYIDLADLKFKLGERIAVEVQFDSEYNLMYGNVSASKIYIQIVDKTE